MKSKRRKKKGKKNKKSAFNGEEENDKDIIENDREDVEGSDGESVQFKNDGFIFKFLSVLCFILQLNI
jgi:hypothetical protein